MFTKVKVDSIPQKLKEAIEKFEKQIAKKQINLHGYMLLKGDQIFAETYWEPYDEMRFHRMYSVTKSLTSIAIGLLEGDGKIKLDDLIIHYFPEKLPDGGAYKWCKEMTIRQMLSMTSCHTTTTCRILKGDDWVKSYFWVKPDKIAGTVFSYETTATHTLTALVEKLSGMKQLDYLRVKFLDEIGFSKDAYILQDPNNVSQGGSGLMCRLSDIAKIAYLCNHYGRYKGKQLLPREYMIQATSKQVPTDLQPTIDERFGYGYMFWKTREEGFAMYGIGGQLAICFPDKDLCFVCMANTIGNPAGLQTIYDNFYDNIYECFEAIGHNNSSFIEEENSIKDQIESRRLYIKMITDQRRYYFEDNNMKLKWLDFDWTQKLIQYENSTGVCQLKFGEEVWIEQLFPGTNYLCRSIGSWDKDHFIITTFLIDEEQGFVKIELAWLEERLSIRAVAASEPFLDYYKGFASSERFS